MAARRGGTCHNPGTSVLWSLSDSTVASVTQRTDSTAIVYGLDHGSSVLVVTDRYEATNRAASMIAVE